MEVLQIVNEFHDYESSTYLHATWSLALRLTMVPCERILAAHWYRPSSGRCDDECSMKVKSRELFWSLYLLGKQKTN